MSLDNRSPAELAALKQSLQQQYDDIKRSGLQLDLTRGKPSAEQLDLSDGLDGILSGDYHMDSTDLRNYGGLDGLPSARALFAPMLGATPEQVIIGGNASLTLMHQCVTIMHCLGLQAPERAWLRAGKVKFLCPVPGYDRHFSICEHLGIEMVTVAMDDNGPDMDQVEALVKADPLIKGIWCVPRFSNPTGCVYSAETVDRLARLALVAGDNFRVFYDNAYAVHTLYDGAPELASIQQACARHGTADSVFVFGSTSKITFAGAGVAFMACSADNRKHLLRHFSFITIGPDKVNQARHVRFLRDQDGIRSVMQGHANLLRPRFEAVLDGLERGLGNEGWGTWTKPKGGYFISLDLRPGLAKRVVQLAAEAGVKLTPAGATFPYGRDPQDANLRIAPSVPKLDEVKRATEVLVCCVKLATVEQLLTG